MRWQLVRGAVPPTKFNLVAEESRLIVPVGLWVLEAACAKFTNWRLQAHTAHLVLAVNVSEIKFRQADFVAQLLG